MIKDYINFLYFYFKAFFAFSCDEDQNCCGRK
jgi:hypothetical protein